MVVDALKAVLQYIHQWVCCSDSESERRSLPPGAAPLPVHSKCTIEAAHSASPVPLKPVHSASLSHCASQSFQKLSSWMSTLCSRSSDKRSYRCWYSTSLLVRPRLTHLPVAQLYLMSSSKHHSPTMIKILNPSITGSHTLCTLVVLLDTILLWVQIIYISQYILLISGFFKSWCGTVNNSWMSHPPQTTWHITGQVSRA